MFIHRGMKTFNLSLKLLIDIIFALVERSYNIPMLLSVSQGPVNDIPIVNDEDQTCCKLYLCCVVIPSSEWVSHDSDKHVQKQDKHYVNWYSKHDVQNSCLIPISQHKLRGVSLSNTELENINKCFIPSFIPEKIHLLIGKVVKVNLTLWEQVEYGTESH